MNVNTHNALLLFNLRVPVNLLTYVIWGKAPNHVQWATIVQFNLPTRNVLWQVTNDREHQGQTGWEDDDQFKRGNEFWLVTNNVNTQNALQRYNFRQPVNQSTSGF